MMSCLMTKFKVDIDKLDKVKRDNIVDGAVEKALTWTAGRQTQDSTVDSNLPPSERSKQALHNLCLGK